MIYPIVGRHGGDVMKMRLAKTTLVFIQSLTGNEMLVKLLAVGDTNGQASCVAEHDKILWMLSQPSKQPRTYWERSLDLRMPLVLWRSRWSVIIIYSLFQYQALILKLFVTHHPSHVSKVVYNDVVCY